MNTTYSAADGNVCSSSFCLKSSLFMLLLSGTKVVGWRFLIPWVKPWLASTKLGERIKKKHLIWVHLLLQGSPENSCWLVLISWVEIIPWGLRIWWLLSHPLQWGGGEPKLLGAATVFPSVLYSASSAPEPRHGQVKVLVLTWIESSALGSASWMFPSNLWKDGVRDSCWNQACLWKNI